MHNIKVEDPNNMIGAGKRNILYRLRRTETIGHIYKIYLLVNYFLQYLNLCNSSINLG